MSASLCQVLAGRWGLLRGGVSGLGDDVAAAVRVEGRSLHDIIMPISVGAGSSASLLLMARGRGAVIAMIDLMPPHATDATRLSSDSGARL